MPAENKERHALGAEPTRDLRFPEGTDFESMSAMIRDAPLDDLVETYHALLASRRAVALAKPFDEHDTCAYGSYPVNKKHVWLGTGIDRGVGLGAWSPTGRNVLRAIDAELRRRGITHPNLPARE